MKAAKIILAVMLTALALAASTANAEETGAAGALKHFNSDEALKLNVSDCETGFSFAVMADTHHSETVFPRFVRMVADAKPAFTVTVGDFTNNGLAEEYERYVKTISDAGVPWFSVPGNHEYRTPAGRTSPDGKKRFEKIFGPADFAFEHCGWRFVLLDVVAYDLLSPSQLKRLDRALSGSGGRAAVFAHYPPSIIDKWAEGIWVSGAEEAMRALKERETRYFFAGHIHVHDSYVAGPTSYIVTGGGGGGLDMDYSTKDLWSPSAGPYHHFIMVDVKGGESSFRIVKLED
jgi:3',5'-cyclic AMP phosphodiesterase CpdA